MKKIVTIIAMLFCGFVSFSQDLTKEIENERLAKEGVVPAKVFVKGKTIEGYIKSIGHAFSDGQEYATPWRHQKEFRFIEKDVFDNATKVKRKMYKKFGTKDCDGYQYDTIKFESVKYSDMTAVGTGMIPQRMFLQIVSEDMVSFYFHYQLPPALSSEDETWGAIYERCGKPELVYRLGKKGKLKLVAYLNIKKELADCKQVVERHKNGEYNKIMEENYSKLLKVANHNAWREQLRWLALQDYMKCQKEEL